MNSTLTQVKREVAVGNSTQPQVKREIATWTRWLHIYLSMFSFAMLLFFAVTGITLNHPSWIEGQQLVEKNSGKLPGSFFSGAGSLHDHQLEIVEYFRNTYGVKAKLTDFTIEEIESSVSFKGPGYAADAFIENPTGNFEITVTKSGVVAVMNDLHKGRDTGTVWAWFIDISAVLMIVVSLTGFLMIFFLRKKRANGLLLFGAGTMLLFVFYYWFVK